MIDLQLDNCCYFGCRLVNAKYRAEADPGGEDDCAEDEFHCLHLNLNQILTIHDWNRQPKTCIPQVWSLTQIFTLLQRFSMIVGFIFSQARFCESVGRITR